MKDLPTEFIDYWKDQGLKITEEVDDDEQSQAAAYYYAFDGMLMPVAIVAIRYRDGVVRYWLDTAGVGTGLPISEEEMLQMLRLKAFW